MASHKYTVGQNLRLRATRLTTLIGLHECKIMRLLPIEDGSYLYRIKCVGEQVERIAKEGDLSFGSIASRPEDAFR
jgi:hypothetical protein